MLERFTIRLPKPLRGEAVTLSAKLHEARRLLDQQSHIPEGTPQAVKSWVNATNQLEDARKKFLELFRRCQPDLPHEIDGWEYDNTSGIFTAEYSSG